jgi:hypothetical protein
LHSELVEVRLQFGFSLEIVAGRQGELYKGQVVSYTRQAGRKQAPRQAVYVLILTYCCLRAD